MLPGRLATDGLDAFVERPTGRLDLIVEVCDDLTLKRELRAAARRLGVPVLMETSERGMLDVERFDVEPQRPLLHGLLDSAPTATLAGMVEHLLFGRPLRERTRASIHAGGQELASWPQLAEEVALGGATVASAARAMLLGGGPRSGRYFFDPGAAWASGPDACR